jgi:hypothetical protein
MIVSGNSKWAEASFDLGVRKVHRVGYDHKFAVGLDKEEQCVEESFTLARERDVQQLSTRKKII